MSDDGRIFLSIVAGIVVFMVLMIVFDPLSMLVGQ
jgi:hypothetical protein